MRNLEGDSPEGGKSAKSETRGGFADPRFPPEQAFLAESWRPRGHLKRKLYPKTVLPKRQYALDNRCNGTTTKGNETTTDFVIH